MRKDDRNLYLSNVAVEEALGLFFQKIRQSNELVKIEYIEAIAALGRVTALPVFARLSSPNYNASAMDGIAVRAEATYGASERNPLQLKKHQDYITVDTGDPIFEPYTAVIMIEDVVEIDEETVEIIQAAAPWQHIRPIGEDIVAKEMILPAKHRIRPMDIGALLSGGITEIAVYRKPTVGIMPTGSEIIEPYETMEIGKIIESNSRIFEGLVIELGGRPKRYRPVPDDYGSLKNQILEAIAENDILIVNAGSSAGSEDYTVKLIRELGEVLVHGIATKPGKPTILGFIQGKPVLGIPGYPVSAYFVFDTFAKPLIHYYLGQPLPVRPSVKAVLSKRTVSSLKHREYIQVKLGQVEGQFIATPLNRGAGVTMSLVRADGILVIPQNSEGVEAGEAVNIELLKPLEVIERTLVSIGSHDLIMDLIANHMHDREDGYDLSSAHVGSLGGIMAIKRGEAHLAPIHLLDESTGEYNVSFVKRYLPGGKMSLIKGVKRIQGFIVQKGNPKNIKDFTDLQRADIQFVNRQRGAGTRILTDYELSKRNIEPESISGYDREMTTHMAVAAAVASGTAHVGVGVLSAAQALDLDFIPIGEEAYDFVTYSKYLNTPGVRTFIQVLQSKALQEELAVLGGYKFEDTGKVIEIL
ncbi:molybdopterin molybdochelatase [Geosporobacter subterraneus DSM 17957]|uniref:Molybdopterin molybdenumtransferase n=1 Tax=Geosporobacter subterraneus DSM 17957 TaxID=1121919 RepID=A0A1M6JB05_9FIRM|nr:molybdopterin biosynthesis protein [Geosporobacter subterraneus]SHJ43812.1 molybdopterin molybdochelatase [Geosporobacter subterraneus DSM 17957]